MIDVFLEKAATYSDAALRISPLLDRILPDPRGQTVLIKPNFVTQRNARLACTHPVIIHAVALACVKRGARVSVGDSPAFGTARSIAREIGLLDMLAPLSVPVITLGKGVRHQSGRASVSIAAQALDADVIINVAKFKAHSQMRYTGAVKNLFGCVGGVRKAWLHARHGDRGHEFAEMICGLMRILPPTVSLLDGVEAMHGTGPIAGERFDLGFLGASRNTVALDTAAGMVLGRTPEDFPIWAHCLREGLPGARPDTLRFPCCHPADFNATGFVLPQTLKPESFRPNTLLRSFVKRLWMALPRRA